MKRCYPMILGCLVLYVTSPVYTANGAPRPSSQPTGGELPTPLLPIPVDPSESILSEYTPQAPPNQKPPPYTLLRFNEDYRYLADPQNRTDLFDPLKYIALNPHDPTSYVSLGGEIRERYEHYTHPGFGVPGQPQHDDYVLQRSTLHADLHVNDHLRFFVQGISGLQFGGTREKAPTNQNPLDLQQAFLDLKLHAEASAYSSYLIVRGGRFEMSYGAGRLVATAHGFDYDIEPIVQVGRFGHRDIRAWTVGTSGGYTFEHTPMQPRLGLQFDVVSGHTGHDGGGALGTFNPLYFKAGYFNDASLIRPSNLIDIHPTLQLLPRDNVLMTLGSDVIWRYTTHDGVYGPPGNLELPARGSSRYVATTAEISAQWQINRHVSWITSSVHFFTGDYVRQAQGGDVNYVGTWVSFIW